MNKKKCVRICKLEPVLDLLVRLGVERPTIAIYAALTHNRTLRSLCNVSPKVREYRIPEDSHGGSILIHAIPGNNPVIPFTLASAFKLRDFRPILLTNRGSLPQEVTVKHYVNERNSLALQRHTLDRFTHEFNLPTFAIGDVLGDRYEPPSVDHLSAGDPFRYGGVEVSPYSKGSIRKYFRRYRFDPSVPEHNRAYRRFVQDGAMFVDATEELIDRFDVVGAVLGEGGYIHGGVPAEVLSKHGIPAYIRGGGRIREHISFGLGRGGAYAPDFDPIQVTNAVSGYVMTDGDRELLEKRLPETSDESVLSRVHSPQTGEGLPDSEQFTVGVFTHKVWDAANAPTAALFPDYYEWLRCTLDTLTAHPELEVYVKAHPEDTPDNSDENVREWLEETYPVLSSHIRFVPPESDISFYRMLSSLDAGVVYASTVGAEMAYNRIPVVIGGYPPYIDYGIGFEPASTGEYVALLQRLPELEVTPQMHARCKRFLYHLFVNKQMPWPLGDVSKGERLDISYALLMSEEMDAIVDPIIAGETVQRRNLAGS